MANNPVFKKTYNSSEITSPRWRCYVADAGVTEGCKLPAVAADPYFIGVSDDDQRKPVDDGTGVTFGAGPLGLTILGDAEIEVSATVTAGSFVQISGVLGRVANAVTASLSAGTHVVGMAKTGAITAGDRVTVNLRPGYVVI